VTRPSRMLLVVALFAVVAVSVLGFMAQRYGSVLERRAEAEKAETEQTLRLVDSFIRVRRALQAADGSFQSALAKGGLGRTEYLHLEKQYREWKAGGQGVGRRFAAAFELRKEELVATEPGARPNAGPRGQPR